MSLRMTAEKWLAGSRNPLRLTTGDHAWEGASMHASGILHDNVTVLIIPVSDAARMDLLLNHGLEYDLDANERYFATTNSVEKTTMRSCNNLRMATNDEDLVLIHDCWFDSALIRLVNKHYKHVADDIVFYGGAQNGHPNIIRMELPCQDWVPFIAPRVELPDEPEAQSFKPPTGEWE